MTAKELAEMLYGREYRNETTKEIEQIAKDNGFVVVFGSSDDLCEFRGAIDDEFGCYNGGTVYLYENGLLENECDYDNCPYFAEKKKTAKKIKIVWNDEGNTCWKYKTDIPHETFNVMEDGELYCIGIVFSISDLK